VLGATAMTGSNERAPSERKESDLNLVANETTLPGTILALTGDPVALDVLMEMAVERGYGLCCRAAGPEAMRILAAELPRVLVIDMEAPGARDLLRAVRANAAWRDIPLLGLTASNNPMITVIVDAPVFFLPELTGLEQALVARLEESPAGGPDSAATSAAPTSASSYGPPSTTISSRSS
jgi:CheY-like chemotaxis protein